MKLNNLINKGYKAIILFCSVSLISTFTFSQTANTLPLTGDVGVGTTAPSAKLEVVGNTKLGGRVDIDSSVVVRDSVTIKKQLIVDQDVLIKGTSTFVGDGKFKADLKVLGVTKLKDKLIVDSTVVMNGDAKIFGDFKLLNYANPTLTTNRLLSIGPNGKVKPISIGIPDPLLPDPNCGNVLAWSYYVNAHNILDPKLYAILCSSYEGVGIGTTTPDATLDVFGNTHLDGNVGIGIAPDNQFQTFIKAATTQIGLCVVGDNTDYNYGVKVIANNANHKAFAINNALIGGDDLFKIMGNGDVYATKVVVQELPFPDYVFNTDYELMTLPDLEKFIKVNKHLPKMPTAEKVKQNGADLGELNRLLVEKIEELTLHAIQQQKSIDVLTQEVEKLKNK